MSDYGDLMFEGLAEREASDFGGTFHWPYAAADAAVGSDYPCSVGPTRTQAKLGPAGVGQSLDTVIVVRKAVIDATGLKSGQPALLTDRLGKARAVKIAPDGIADLVFAWEITLVHPAQKV